MNSIELAKAAQQDAKQYAAVLSAALVRKVELAYIAQWLDAQDLSVRAKAATTACSAIEVLRINHTGLEAVHQDASGAILEALEAQRPRTSSAG